MIVYITLCKFQNYTSMTMTKRLSPCQLSVFLFLSTTDKPGMNFLFLQETKLKLFLQSQQFTVPILFPNDNQT